MSNGAPVTKEPYRYRPASILITDEEGVRRAEIANTEIARLGKILTECQEYSQTLVVKLKAVLEAAQPQ